MKTVRVALCWYAVYLALRLGYFYLGGMTLTEWATAALMAFPLLVWVMMALLTIPASLRAASLVGKLTWRRSLLAQTCWLVAWFPCEILAGMVFFVAPFHLELVASSEVWILYLLTHVLGPLPAAFLGTLAYRWFVDGTVEASADMSSTVEASVEWSSGRALCNGVGPPHPR